MLIPIVVAVVLHHYWLYKHFLAKKRYTVYVAMLLPFALIVVMINVISQITLDFTDFNVAISKRLLQKACRFALAFDLPFILFYTALRGRKDQKKRKQELEAERKKMTIQLLKNQLEPHFLFNTLNGIYATAQKENAKNTQMGIEELCNITRYATECAKKRFVPVESELRFMEQYLYLQKMMAEGRTELRIETEMSWDNVPVSIPPMLLLPFITNAIKNADTEQLMTIDIAVTDRTLQLTIAYKNRLDNASTTKASALPAEALKLLHMEYRERYNFSETEERNRQTLALQIDLVQAPLTSKQKRQHAVS